MSQPIQKWLLSRTGFVSLINDKLAARKGVVGRIFTWLKVGPRQMGTHTLPKVVKFYNQYFMLTYQMGSSLRPIFSRFIGMTYGPLNYTGLMLWFVMTISLMNRFKFNRARDVIQFNSQDNPEFWFRAFNMMFPPNYLNNKISAHYIEINSIYSFEMFKRYRTARNEILEERAISSDKEKRTRYITNANYVYEPLGDDTTAVKKLFN